MNPWERRIQGVGRRLKERAIDSRRRVREHLNVGTVVAGVVIAVISGVILAFILRAWFDEGEPPDPTVPEDLPLMIVEFREFSAEPVGDCTALISWSTAGAGEGTVSLFRDDSLVDSFSLDPIEYVDDLEGRQDPVIYQLRGESVDGAETISDAKTVVPDCP